MKYRLIPFFIFSFLFLFNSFSAKASNLLYDQSSSSTFCDFYVDCLPPYTTFSTPTNFSSSSKIGQVALSMRRNTDYTFADCTFMLLLMDESNTQYTSAPISANLIPTSFTDQIFDFSSDLLDLSAHQLSKISLFGNNTCAIYSDNVWNYVEIETVVPSVNNLISNNQPYKDGWGTDWTMKFAIYDNETSSFFNLIVENPQEGQVLLPGSIIFSGSYTNNTEYNHGMIEIYNKDSNYYMFDMFSASQEEGSFSRTKVLSEGNYSWNYYLLDSTTSATSSPSDTTNFIVGTSTPYLVATSTFPSIPDFENQDFGLLGNMFRDVIAWLFYPSQNAIEAFTNVRTELMEKSPFGYFTLAREKMLAINLSSASAPVLTVSANFGNGNTNMKLFDMSETADVVGSTGMTLIYNIIKYAVWLGFLAFCYHEVKRIFSSSNV